jgi:hypothetical protein
VTVPVAPLEDADVPRFVAALGIPGIVDPHVHFLPESVLRKVWAYLDQAQEHYGTPWPVHYRLPEPERVATLYELGVTTYAPLVYPHRPGMARWLTDWVTDFAERTPAAVRTATAFTERFAPLPRDWPARLAGVADRIVFGSDFPNIPYAYAEQVQAVAAWAAADDRLGATFLRSVLHDAPARLLAR